MLSKIAEVVTIIKLESEAAKLLPSNPRASISIDPIALLGTW